MIQDHYPRDRASYMSHIGKKIAKARTKMNTPITTVMTGSSVAVNLRTLSWTSASVMAPISPSMSSIAPASSPTCIIFRT